MESRKIPPRTISDLLALSDVEEDSYEDLDQLLNTTTENNTDDPNDNEKAIDDITEILQSVEVSASLLPTLPVHVHENINAPSTGVADTSKSPRTVPNEYSNNDNNILLSEEPDFLSSSPIHPIPTDNNDRNVPSSANRLSLSPTTLLNSLLSQSDIVLDDGRSEQYVNSASIVQRISSFSVDDTTFTNANVAVDDTTFMNANMEISKSVDISNDNIDSSFLNDIHKDVNDGSADFVHSGSDDDDGMNSFVTAREDGDGTSTVYSKESTVITAVIDNKSNAEEIVRNNYEDVSIELLKEPETVDSENDIVTPIDRQITGSVSFHTSTDTKYEVTNAPLWEDDDPSTPKRSGREFLMPVANAPKNSTENHNTTTSSISVSVGTAAEHQNPNSEANIGNTNNTGETTAEVMGNAESVHGNGANIESDIINLLGCVPLTEVSNPAGTIPPSTIDRLSVPALSEANSTDTKGSQEKGENDVLVVSNTASDDSERKRGEVVHAVEEHGTMHSSKIASNNEATITVIDNILEHTESNNAEEPIQPDDFDVNRNTLSPRVDMNDAESQRTNLESVVDSKTEQHVPGLPTLSAENLFSLNTNSTNAFQIQRGNELKSLQVEFPSILSKSQKKSDVSLSSASSTISHGSFSKTHGANAAFVPFPDNEQQHRRHKSNDSLPPRSPKKGSSSLENQKIPSSTATKLFPPGKETDENDTERVETKWMKQSLSIAFNPKRSIFADKHDTNARPCSLSPPGSPPEPCYSDSDVDDADSFHEETRTASSSGIKNMNSSPGLWDMMIEEESLPDKHWTDKSDYVHCDQGRTYHNQTQCNDESIAESSVSPSEAGVSKSIHLSTKPSFKSDTSISSSVFKRSGVNKLLSLSQHSKGSYSSARSSQGRKEKRVTLTPFVSRSSVYHFGRVEVDVSSLGRYSSYEASSPERISMFAMHSSSPDLYKLNEESQSSNQASPIKQIEISTLMHSSNEIDSEALITEAQPQDILSPESLVQKYSLYQENEALKCEENATMLEEQLLEFSTICPFDLPLLDTELSSSVKKIGALKWKQLVANWKHSELFRTMVSSLYSPETDWYKDDKEVKSTYSASSGRVGTKVCGAIELGNVPIQSKSKNEETTYSQVNPRFSDLSLSSYLTSIESGSFEVPSQKIRHRVSMTGSSEAALRILYDAAQRNVSVLNSILHDIVAFASINCSNQAECDSIAYTIHVKDQTAIERKAKGKYGGDICQVKDILRSQITFRNEAELVCGLVRLLEKGKTPSNIDTEDPEKITLIRIKNLFSCDVFGDLPTSSLPTGYRHVLLNLRLPDGLIFELQLNLLPMFQVLGQEGFTLHRSLCDIKDLSNERDLDPKKFISFGMNELIAEMLSCSSGNLSLISFFDANLPCINSKSSGGDKDNDVVKDVAAAEPKNDNKCMVGVFESASDEIGGAQSMVNSLDNTATADDILLAILQCGSNNISRNPRDFASYWCMYTLFSFVLKSEKSEETLSNNMDAKPSIVNYARQSLLQCLTISNQAISTGMTRIVEYESSSEIDHAAGQSFTVLQCLANDCARDQRWVDAESVCRALVICCEQHLPLYHPITLTSLLDLSVSSSMIGNQSFADRILNRTAERLSKYLFEMERLYTSHLSKARSVYKPGHTLFTVEHGRDAIFELHAFASLFQRQLNREMVALVGVDNEVVIANRCFVADTLSVLANCTASAHFFLGTLSDGSDDCGSQYWRMAYRHYELCYTSLAATKQLDDPFVVRSLFGAARCLREFGQTENALKLLSFVVSFKCDVEGRSNSDTSDGPPAIALEESKADADGTTTTRCSRTPRFLPVSTMSPIGSDANFIPKSMSLALCLWFMSILSVDEKRDEEGREQAFGYLHAASVLIEASIHNACDFCDDATRAMCIRFLSMIENEAEQISEPLYE